MSMTGEIRSLFLDKDKNQVLFPTTKVKAISDDDGVGLNVLLEDIAYSGDPVSDTETAPINADTLGGRPVEYFATESFVTNKIAEAQLSGDSNTSNIDLSGYATKDFVFDNLPSATSDLTNDSGYITKSDVPTKVSQLTNDSGFITSSSIPTKTSQLTNNSGYITSSSVPTKVSQLTNDKGYITSAPYVTDKATGTPTYLNYSADGMTSTSWIACWDGYTLKGISPANLNKVLGTSAITQMKTATTTCSYDYSNDNVDWSTGTVTMDWFYKVYSDGTAEAVGVSRNTVPVWTCAAWGNMHETGQFRIPSPLNFKAGPHITVGAQAASAWFVSEGLTYGGQCVATYFCRATPSINQYAYITVQINGKLA